MEMYMPRGGDLVLAKRLTLIILLLLTSITIVACGNNNGNPAQYELTEDGIIKAEDAEEIIKDRANMLIHAIEAKDFEKVAEFVHPMKGLRFTPYTYVSEEDDLVFSQEETKNYQDNPETYLWGKYDGTGHPILLTTDQYYEEFIYSEKFTEAKEVGYNELLSSGNMIENQFDVYERPIVVEYYFPGFNTEYAGIDWKSLRLVFEEYENEWRLVGIIHNQWTI